MINKHEKIPVSFDSEYCIFEKVNDTYDSDKESINSDYSDISEKNDHQNKKYTEYIEELNNNYSFIKKKDNKKIIKKANVKKEIKEELVEESYLSD